MTGPTTAPVSDVPGKSLGIVGLVLAIIAAPVGLIISLVARSQSKKAGAKNTPATAGIIIGIILTILWIVLFVVMPMVLMASGLGTCTVTVNGVTQAC